MRTSNNVSITSVLVPSKDGRNICEYERSRIVVYATNTLVFEILRELEVRFGSDIRFDIRLFLAFSEYSIFGFLPTFSEANIMFFTIKF